MATEIGQNFEMRAGETKTLRFTITDDDATFDPDTVTFTWTAGESAITKTALKDSATEWLVRLEPADTDGWRERELPHQLVGVDGTGATEVVAEGTLTVKDRLGD